MLEGLEISEIEYSKICLENRFDSEFYQKKFLENERVLRLKPFFLVGDRFKVTDGEHGSVVEQESGIKYLTAENVKCGYVDISNVRFVSEEVDKRNARARVEVGDILISIKGTLGAIGIAEEWLLPANMNRDVAILKPKNKPTNSAATALFLMSRFGLLQSSRGGSGGVQQMITLERLRKFIQPVFSPAFEQVLEQQIKNIQGLRVSSGGLYTQAEQILLKAVGMADFKPTSQNINIKTFAQSFGSNGRLDAEYYQPKYECYENLIKSHPNGYTLINHEYEHFCTISRKPKAAYNYIEISNVNVSDGTNTPNLIESSELPDNAKYEVKTGDLIISKVRPNRGAITVIESDADNLIVSGAFTVLREKPESVFTKEVLKVLLRTPIYREWMLKFNIGTQYPVIRDDDILNLPIPKIDLETQTQISELIQQSFILKTESERLLNVAKRAVEIAIEQDEVAGLTFIEKETEANHVIH